MLRRPAVNLVNALTKSLGEGTQQVKDVSVELSFPMARKEAPVLQV